MNAVSACLARTVETAWIAGTARTVRIASVVPIALVVLV